MSDLIEKNQSTTDLLSRVLSDIFSETTNLIVNNNGTFNIKIMFDSKIFIIMEIVDNILGLVEIKKSTYTSNTSILLEKIVEFGRTISFIEYVVIEEDESRIYFDKISHKKLYINLFEISLLAYGMTWYNRNGFGKQNPKWANFIKSSLFDFLESIRFDNINNDFLSTYTKSSISDSFKDIILNLKLINNKKMIESEDIVYIEFICELLRYIFSPMSSDNFYEKDGEMYIQCKYVPDISSLYDVKLVL